MKLTQRDTMLLAVLGVVAVTAGLWYFLVRPVSADVGAQRETLTQVTAESAALRDTLARLDEAGPPKPAGVVQRLRIAKALPDRPHAPGTLVELQRLALRADVELTGVRTLAATLQGGLLSTQYEVKVTGDFFDVDDFLYRLHRQVEVNEKRLPTVRGQLYATTSVSMDAGDGDESGPMGTVDATVKVVAFAADGDESAAAPATGAAATTPLSGAAPPATPSTTGAGG